MNSKSTGSQSAKASFSMDDFAKALEQHNYEFQKGQVVRGKVFEYDSNGAYVDIGGKSSAFLPNFFRASSNSSSSSASNAPIT